MEIKSLVGEIIENLDLLEQMPKMITDEIKSLDKETQDILHLMEFASFNACEGYKLAKRMQDVRILRRNYKDMQEEIIRVTPVLGRHKQFKNELKHSIISIDSVNNKQDKRIYGARVIDEDDDLAQLRAVNKTRINFQRDPYMNKLDSLFEQIQQTDCIVVNS